MGLLACRLLDKAKPSPGMAAARATISRQVEMAVAKAAKTGEERGSC